MRETMSESHLTHLTAEQGQMLLDVALQFGATLDLDTLLPLVLTHVTDMLRAERALIALFDLSGEVDRAVVHNLDWGGPGHPLPVSSSLIAQVLRDGRPVVVADASIDEQYQGNLSVRMFGLRFMMGVPIPSRGRVFGVLYVDSQASKVEDLQRETALLEAIGRLVGTAAENARLFEELRYRNRLLAAMVHDFRGLLSVILANGELIAGVSEDTEEV
jgi:GAF domain-containing protein